MTTEALAAPAPRAAKSPARRRVFRLLKFLPLLVLAVFVVRQRFFVAVPARAFTVDKGDVVREVFGRGTVESRRAVELGFDIVGRISDLLVDEGDRVKLGQVVAHLAPEQLAADAKAASSGVSLAKAAIGRLDAEEHRAAAALVFAKAEEARMQMLAQSRSISPRDLDLAVQQLALAQAERDRVAAAQGEARRQIAVASGAADSRSANVARAVLVSPFDGIIIRRLRDPGDTVTVGTTVLRVVATDALWSRAWIDEAALPGLREGQNVRIRLGAEGNVMLAGKVDRIGREADRQTHELLVDVLLSGVPSRIAIGQRADAWIELERRRDVTRIPFAFVWRDAEGDYCFVDRDERIARAQLKLGLRGVESVEVLEGLAPGDVVLGPIEPGGTLAEGRRFARSGT